MFNRPQQPGNKGILDNSADMLRHMVQLMAGFLTPEPQRRANPHSRAYTKAYADQRQKAGGRVHHLLAQQKLANQKLGLILPRPAPQPSAAVRDLRGNHRPRHYWA